ncbi:MAG: T9SS type A sorting domain-containing protein, partial [Chitinophagaceae bacterium]
ANWWVDFEITFFQAGYTTNNKKVELKSINVTGVDIDGDNQTLKEYAEMYEITRNTLSPTTVLLPTLLATLPNNTYSGKPEFNYKFLGPVTNFTNIDTNSVDVMATNLYEYKKKISFRLGAVTGASTTSAGMRMNSIWFKNFNLTPIITLPVKLASFSAMLNTDKVDLKWVTTSEKNVSHFSIEKSTDGKNYSEAGLVFAYGNTSETINYSFTDKNISTSKAGLVYYRLRSVDIDGKNELSHVRSVRIGNRKEQSISILTYPNPVVSELRVTIPANWQGKKVTYELFNTNGQVAKRTVTACSSQTETINSNSIFPGFYIMKVTCNGETAQQMIIKN